MSREAVLALDLGTTGVRALVVDASGSVRGRAYRPLPTAYPIPGHVEQDPEQMWSLSREVLREALERARVGAVEIAGLGVVTQRSTTLAWDAQSGTPLVPAIGWQDQRTVARVAELRAAGLPFNTLASATKLEWCLAHAPPVREAAAGGRLRFGTPESWLTWRLTDGQAHVTDPSHASCTALCDLGGGCWAPALLELFGVDEETLPRIVPTSAIVGETPAALLGAPVPVAARAGDQQAATFAQGVHAPGAAKLTLGTSAMLDLHTGAAPAPPPEGAYPLALWRLEEGEAVFCLEGTVITAGAALDWLVGLGLVREAAEADALARSVASSQGVAFVPALQGLGTPFLDDEARGLLGGLTRGSGRAEIARAALEGVAQRCADVCEALVLDSTPLRVDGGLARSDFLMQALADLGGRAVLRAAETETTALGAAFLAGLACGIWRSASDCAELLPEPAAFSPRLGSKARGAVRQRWRDVVARARSA